MVRADRDIVLTLLKVCRHIVMYFVLKAKVFALGEWYSCRGLAVVANSSI